MNFSRLLDKDLFTLLISIICSLILFFNSKSDLVLAVQADIVDAINFLTYPQRWYKNIFTIKKENEKMANELFMANMVLNKYAHYKYENDSLERIIRIATHISGVLDTTLVVSELKDPQLVTLVPARITNKNSSSIETIIINVGKNDISSMKKDLAVLDISGSLLGKTITVGYNTSKVQLITDNNFSVSIRVGDDQPLGNFIPTIGKYGILKGIPKESAELSIGDTAYTSGISNIYLADIPVAKVISFNEDNNKAFQDVIVEILSDFNNLNYVFVIQ